MALEFDMVSRLVLFFVGFITCFLSAEPNFSIQADVAVPEPAPLDAASESKSPANGGRNPTHGVETVVWGNLLPIGRVVFQCNSHSSLTPFGYVP
jgi:hypothetical protein